MRMLTLLAPVFLLGCRDTRIDLTPPPAPLPETSSPWSAPLVVYTQTAHPISFPYATDYGALEDQWLSAINDERVKHGVPALLVDSLAVEGARAHAFHMHLHNFLSTVNPEGDGPAQRYAWLGASYRTLRETVLAIETVDVSLFGPELLATDVNYVGIGVWRAPLAGVYLVAVDFTWR